MIFRSQSNPERYEMMLKESTAFGIFIVKLNKDDEKNDSNFNGTSIPAKQWQKRANIYAENDFFLCVGDKNITMPDYFDCLTKRREKMTMEI